MSLEPRSQHRLGALAALALVVVGVLACNDPAAVQRRYLAKTMPATLGLAAGPAAFQGEPRIGKVRVWADADYRAQHVNWKRDVGDQLDLANQLLTPMLGLRLEVAEWKAWERRATGERLHDSLAALVAEDDGEGVHWVIGLVSSLSLVSATMDELGMAQVLGKHLVVRGYADVEERKAFARAFPDVPEEERDDVHEVRRRHKQAVVLLHEIGHTLGAIHETDPKWILHAAYGAEQTSISDRNRDLMRIALDDRLVDADATATREKLLAVLESSEWGGWDPAERAAEIAELHAAITAARATSAAPPVPVEVADQVERAAALGRSGKPTEALVELEPLLAAYPGNAAIRLMACKLTLAAHGHADPRAGAVCARAADLAPADPGAFLALAAAHAAAGDEPATLASLAEARARLSKLEGPERTPAWLALADAYQGMGAVSLAEDAVRQAGTDAAAITTWATKTRARYGVPPDGARFKITPEREAAYVRAVRGLLDLVYAGKYPEAERAAAKATKEFPGAPGIAAARCDLAMRKQQLAVARRHCAAAIKAWDGTAWAHYLMGVLILRGQDTDAAIASLTRAIAADPELSQAYRALGKAYERRKDQAALEALRRDYQARFGQRLP